MSDRIINNSKMAECKIYADTLDDFLREKNNIYKTHIIQKMNVLQKMGYTIIYTIKGTNQKIIYATLIHLAHTLPKQTFIECIKRFCDCSMLDMLDNMGPVKCIFDYTFMYDLSNNIYESITSLELNEKINQKFCMKMLKALRIKKMILYSLSNTKRHPIVEFLCDLNKEDVLIDHITLASLQDDYDFVAII